MKESKEIIVKVNDWDDRNELLTILAVSGYLVSVKFINDETSNYVPETWIVARK